MDHMTLNAQDRCDRCGAQAYVKARIKTGGELLFCAHHGDENALTLIQNGHIIVIDEREKLKKAPTPATT